MGKSLAISFIILLIFPGCLEQANNRQVIPQYITAIIKYFDSNRIKEYDTVKFDKKVNWGNNFWQVATQEVIAYNYETGFGYMADSGYTFPVEDSLERFWVSDVKLFNKKFPMRVTLPNNNIDIIRLKNGLIDCSLNSFNISYKIDHNRLFITDEKALFLQTNPFDYFRSRTKEMDSLGVQSISGHSAGNWITITLNTQKDYLDYLPANLIVEETYRRIFDSIITTGIRLNKNWVWRRKAAPETKN